MRRTMKVLAAVGGALLAGTAMAQTPGPKCSIKTRLDHFSGTHNILVVSCVPDEITSITCEKWTMLGINSWHNQNDFTIPAGLAVTVMNANGFEGYCSKPDSIVAHTDSGDYVGVLDRGAGNWNESTKLTISPK
jgi:hypothetical protein